MTILRSCPTRLASWLALAAWLGLAASARAQSVGTVGMDKSFDVQLFQSAMGPRPFLTLDSAQVPSHLQFTMSLATSYQRDPFTLDLMKVDEHVTKTVEVVRDQITSELTGAIGIKNRFQVGLAVPYTMLQRGNDFTSRGEASGYSLQGGGIGDLRLEGKALATRGGPANELTLSVASGLTLPTGNGERFGGEKNVTGRLRGITELRLEDLRAVAVLGFLFRQPAKTFVAEVGQQLLYGGAVEYSVHRDASLLAEVFGRSGLKDFSKGYADANPLEADLGMRVALPQMMTLTIGGGLGLTPGIGAPKFRGFLALGWAPDFTDTDNDGVYDHRDRCPTELEDHDGYRDGDGCPEPDNDNDNVLDAQDKCPTLAEDIDDFQDQDGCPEPDNDNDSILDANDPCPNAAEDGRGKRPKDGCPSSTEDGDGDEIPDVRDKCPEDPEDKDGFQDDDGCPEIDNDNDGIPDNFDGCPNEAEDPDGVSDDDGCPDPDNDRDGFLDTEDKCPAEPESLNLNRDDDGCPDPGDLIMALGEEAIEVGERIPFSGKTGLHANAQPILHLVALVMKGNPEITKLRVEVRAEGLSREDTQARADAVVAFLESKGVAAARLKSVGMGGGANRVDFVIEAREEPKKPGAAAGPEAPAEVPAPTNP